MLPIAVRDAVHLRRTDLDVGLSEQRLGRLKRRNSPAYSLFSRLAPGRPRYQTLPSKGLARAG